MGHEFSNADLKVHLTNRINSAVNHFKGTFRHWDVNNEMLHGNYFGNRLGNWVNPWMFQHARLQDADVQLFVNDYNVVAGNETDAYKQQILSLIASNAPVGGIGAQGHFGSTVNPMLTESRLDSLAELGLPIWITEYDSVNADASIRADNLETLYRIAFSKQAVDGILMWGFWAGSHWLGSNAAIVNLNWTLNAAGQRYQSLLTEWTTVTNGTSGGDGAFDFRGFHGSYDITITAPGGQPTLRQSPWTPAPAQTSSHSSPTRPAQNRCSTSPDPHPPTAHFNSNSPATPAAFCDPDLDQPKHHQLDNAHHSYQSLRHHLLHQSRSATAIGTVLPRQGVAVNKRDVDCALRLRS